MKITYLNVLRFMLTLAASTSIASNTLAQPKATPNTTGGLPTAGNPKFEARELGRVAGALYDQHQWRRAFYWYQEAENKFHSPKFVLYMARCKGNIGELVAASHLYKRVIDEPLPTAATRQYTEAQLEAKDELESLQNRIARILVILTNTNGRNVRIMIDGWQQGIVDKPIEVDPGKHTIVITWDEDQRYTREMAVAEGKSGIFAASLRPKVVKSAPSLIIPGLIMSAGGIVLVAGIGTSVYAGKAWEPCFDNSCANNQESARKFDAIATSAVVAGVLTVAVGGIWLGVAHDYGRTRKSASATILPVITPSGVFLTGTF